MVASLAVSSVGDVPVEVASVRVSLMHSAIVVRVCGGDHPSTSRETSGSRDAGAPAAHTLHDVKLANLQGPRPDKEMWEIH
jgi:hypothetical protein